MRRDVFAEILDKCDVVTTPGSGFGPAGEGFVRASAFAHRFVIFDPSLFGSFYCLLHLPQNPAQRLATPARGSCAPQPSRTGDITVISRFAYVCLASESKAQGSAPLARDLCSHLHRCGIKVQQKLQHDYCETPGIAHGAVCCLQRPEKHSASMRRSVPDCRMAVKLKLSSGVFRRGSLSELLCWHDGSV